MKTYFINGEKIELSEQAEAFKDSCIDSNTCDELIDCLLCSHVDQTSTKDWNIGESEYRSAIAVALQTKIKFLQDEI